MIGGHIFERVRLIEDHYFVIRQQVRALTPQGQITEKESVIDNKQLSTEHPLARLEIETPGVIGTAAAQAVAAIALHEVPHGRKYLKRQIAAAAVARGPRPTANLLQLLDCRRLDQQRRQALLRPTQPPQTEIIRAALD